MKMRILHAYLKKKKKMLYITEDFVVISYPNTFGFIFIELEVR